MPKELHYPGCTGQGASALADIRVGLRPPDFPLLPVKSGSPRSDTPGLRRSQTSATRGRCMNGSLFDRLAAGRCAHVPTEIAFPKRPNLPRRGDIPSCSTNILTRTLSSHLRVAKTS
jgi:hypothetical protein